MTGDIRTRTNICLSKKPTRGPHGYTPHPNDAHRQFKPDHRDCSAWPPPFGSVSDDDLAWRSINVYIRSGFVSFRNFTLSNF